MSSNARIITARNVNDALETGLWFLKSEGITTGSRNGPVLVAPGPVTTMYKYPRERVLWSPVRDANPFFHLFESMWMLAGRNDTASLNPLVPRMNTFSDDEKTLNGAYGYRWRNYFGYDQLKEIAAALRKDHSTRRAVLSMWNAYEDGNTVFVPGNYVPSDLRNQGSKDLPCNTHIYFDASRGRLDMTVCNRSNDVIWGAYGANSVHMSFLHEWIALASGIEMGVYYQMSNNYHVYTERSDVQRLLKCGVNTPREQWHVNYQPEDLYYAGDVARGFRPVSLLVGDEWMAANHFLDEMNDWCENGGYLASPVYRFTRNVLNPVMAAHRLHKAGATEDAVRVLLAAPPSDWRGACINWLQRRTSIKHTNSPVV